MTNCKSIIEQLELFAPKTLACKWDNVGLLVGDKNWKVSKILLALDITSDIIDETIEIGANMIITHHPMIMGQGLKTVTSDNLKGRLIIKAIQNNISIYAAHTNLDSVQNGINDYLCELFYLTEVITIDQESNILRMGKLRANEETLESFAQIIKHKLGLDTIKVTGNLQRFVEKVAVCSGSGATDEYIKMAIDNGCDVFVTGDIKYHTARDAADQNLAMIDFTHYASEVIYLDYLKNFLISSNANINVSISRKDKPAWVNI